MREYYERINIVYLHNENIYGSVEKLGAFASIVKYEKDGIEYNELFENDDFSVVDEIVLVHYEEE